jgi:hypothetical protein
MFDSIFIFIEAIITVVLFAKFSQQFHGLGILVGLFLDPSRDHV